MRVSKALFQPVDQPGGRARAEGGGARELLHGQVPAVLTAQRIEHGVLHDREVDGCLQRAFEVGLDRCVEGGGRPPPLGPNFDRVVFDAHACSRCLRAAHPAAPAGTGTRPPSAPSLRFANRISGPARSVNAVPITDSRCERRKRQSCPEGPSGSGALRGFGALRLKRKPSTRMRKQAAAATNEAVRPLKPISMPVTARAAPTRAGMA
jgi:hypothetical protein